MFAKRFVVALIVLAVAVFPPAVAFCAPGGPVLFQTYAWEQNIDVFISGNIKPADIICKVSNQPAQIIEHGLLADKGIISRTTLLVDISTSMPSAARENVKSLIDAFIEQTGGNEQYRIVAFGEQLSVLQDFSSDRYDLANAAEKIEFNAQESKIYDAIYNTIPPIQTIDGTACFYRTIAITDGIDDTQSGITKEELYLRLQKETYPIDVIEVSAKTKQEQDKNLSALTRISGGNYYHLDAGTNAAALPPELALKDIYWLRIETPASMLDGSVRQVNIDDGSNSVVFDVKTPIFDAPSESAPPPSQASSAAPAPKPAPAQSNPVPPKQKIPAGLIIAAAVIIAAVIAAAAFIIIRAKKKDTRAASGGKNESGRLTDNDGTVFLRDSGENQMSDSGALVTLRLKDDCSRSWTVSLTDEILIGRGKNCGIKIDDESVSRRQCKIYLNSSDAATVENLSDSNITRLNGRLLDTPLEIKTGDELKCGRAVLIVDSLRTDGGNLSKGTMFINV